MLFLPGSFFSWLMRASHSPTCIINLCLSSLLGWLDMHEYFAEESHKQKKWLNDFEWHFLVNKKRAFSHQISIELFSVFNNDRCSSHFFSQVCPIRPFYILVKQNIERLLGHCSQCDECSSDDYLFQYIWVYTRVLPFNSHWGDLSSC